MIRRRRSGSAAVEAPPASLASAVAPATVEVTPRWLRVGDGYAATLVVTGIVTGDCRMPAAQR